MSALKHGGRLVSRRSALVALGALGLLGAGPAAAQDYPSKPIRLVVGYPPGGSNDIVTRIIAPPLGEALGANVIVENRAGASGTLGAGYVANAEPDGYTLLSSSASPVVIAPHTLPKRPFDATRAFVPINTVGLMPEAIAVRPDLGVSTLKELIDLTRKQQVTLSSSGNGGLPHLTIELLIQETKANFLHVPYKGAGPAVTDTLAGHVNGIVMDVPPLYPYIKDGKLKALAVTSDKRVEFLPGVPTAQEVLPGFSVTNWLGLFAPAGTPAAVVDKLNDALKKVVAREDVRRQLVKVAVVPSSMETPAAFRTFVAKEWDRWGTLVKEKNISSGG